jgi:hypothetical protein
MTNRWDAFTVGDVLVNNRLLPQDPEHKVVVFERLEHAFKVFFLDEGRIRTAEWTDALIAGKTKNAYSIVKVGHTDSIENLMASFGD